MGRPDAGAVEQTNRWMLRARDAIDRDYARPLDIPALASTAMALLRHTDRSVTEVCHAAGFTSLGTFSRTFRTIVGDSPARYRQRAAPPAPVPTCFVMAWTRPSSFGEAPVAREAVALPPCSETSPTP